MMRRLVLLLPLLASCAHYQNVPVPPRVDVLHYGAVGVIQFSSAGPRQGLLPHATRRFLEQVMRAQPGVRVVELGTVQQALARVGRQQLDGEAIRALATQSQLQAIFAGGLELTDAKPSVSVADFARNVSLSADVTATLSVTLFEASGALVWTDSIAQRDSAGGVSLAGGSVGVGVDGEDHAYQRLVDSEVFSITEPFRGHWIRQRVEER
jgi:hypothetical protein